VNRALQFAMFFLLMILLVGGVHYYLWVRLVRDPALPQPWRLVGTIGIVLLGLLIPATMFARRFLGGTPALLYWAVMIWLGAMFIVFCLVFATDIVRVGGWILDKLVGRDTPRDPERRRFFARLIGGGVVTAGAGLSALAIRAATAAVKIKEVRVPLARLPRSMSGTTIAQITDLHIGPTIRRDYVEIVVAKTNALQPDIIAITGDLVDGSVEELREHAAPLANLKAKYGVFFVTGNHEYYAGVEPWIAELTRLGIRVLRNERVTIGQGEESFDLAGVDDWSSRGDGHGHDLARAVAGRDPQRELVLLAHQPRAVNDAAEHGVGLQLSGHTHGGQIWPWRYMVYLQQPYVSGLARHLERTWIYVSSGTGYWGPPMRLLAPAEISKIVLEVHA
jgi:uncharacterized protein